MKKGLEAGDRGLGPDAQRLLRRREQRSAFWLQPPAKQRGVALITAVLIVALATILAHANRDTAPAALLAYERLRRERVAQVQRGARENGLRYDSAYSDLGLRDAELAAHAAFRRTLYDHDVVPNAEAVAVAELA